MYCRMCGERLDDKAQYCAHCGAKVNNEPDKQSESLEEHVTAGRKTNKNKIWVGSITLLVILVVILLIILPRKKNFVSADDSEMKNEYIGVEETEYTGVVRTEEQPELATEMTEASTENQELEKCKQMYMDIVRQQEEEYSGEDYRYGLVYIDDDEIPELVTGIWGYWTSLYTYDSGKIYTLMDKWGYGTGSSCYYYLPGKNVIYRYGTLQAGIIYYDEYWRVDSNFEICPYYEEELSIWSYKDQNNDGNLDYESEVVGDEGKYYYYGTQELTKEQYEQYLIDGDYQELTGTESTIDIRED